MDDDRTRGWLLARLSLAVAVITVVAIPLLAPEGPMSGLSQWESFGYTHGPIVAEVLAIAGLVWMLWIWRAGGRDSSSAWRYRDRVEPTPAYEPPGDRPPGDRPIEGTRATGWLLARIELAVGATVVLLIPILFVGTPTFMGGWRIVEAIAAEALAIAGLVWMVRIWRGPLRDQVPAWRYRR